MIKHPKSRTLTAIITDLNKPRRKTKAEKAFFERLADYPHSYREEVFCWLWDNHDELVELRRRWMTSWNTIALIMIEDGVKGHNGVTPTADAVRKVWKRVCREIEEEKRKRPSQVIPLPTSR